jgi:3-oxoadipate enol-lactonase
MATIETSDGVRIHCVEDGPPDAPPLVLAGPLGATLDIWEPQMAEAARRFRTFRYDPRGHGGSDAPDGSYTIERLGQDLADLLDGLNIARADVCGVSMGGMAAMWLAIHAPKRVHRLVLANTSPQVPPMTLWDERIQIATTQGMAGLADRIVERWFSADFREREPQRVAWVRDMLLAANPVGYAGCCAAIRDMDQRVSIATIAAPTLVIVGEHDPATPPGHGRLIAESIPGAEYIEIEGVAHLPSVEAPERFNRALFGFLEGRAA